MESSTIITIITAFITYILGYISGIYLPMKFRKQDKMPKISIGTLQERQNYFDITNHGGDILNLKINISWLQENVKQNRGMITFFNSNEDPAIGYSHNCNCLKKGETKKVTSCPLYSDNGEIEVLVVGTDITNKQYKEKFIIKNNIKNN